MARIEATCPQCGTVTCRAKDFELRQWAGTGMYYAFHCPKCRELVQKPADAHAVSVLQGQGVKMRTWGPSEGSEGRDGPPLTYDDLIDFHLLLERPGWFDTLQSHSA